MAGCHLLNLLLIQGGLGGEVERLQPLDERKSGETRAHRDILLGLGGDFFTEHAEMGKGLFMGLEKLREPLIRTGVIEPASAEPQREDEHMHHDGTGAERHPRLPQSI